jgi:hypothetical protein
MFVIPLFAEATPRRLRTGSRWQNETRSSPFIERVMRITQFGGSTFRLSGTFAQLQKKRPQPWRELRPLTAGGQPEEEGPLPTIGTAGRACGFVVSFTIASGGRCVDQFIVRCTKAVPRVTTHTNE